jgi:NurA-like 5'-3' nuclease
VNGNIRSTDGGYALVKQLIIAVKEQWYELVSWMDEFYKQLTEEAKFKEEAPWRLVGRCVAAIFDSMADYRAKVALIEDPKPLQNKAKIMWCVLQCHVVMGTFMAVNFQGHPIVVKEITMFMLTEGIDPDDLTRMTTKLELQKTANTSATTNVAELEKTLNELKRAFDNHVANAFNTLKNKVENR